MKKIAKLTEDLRAVTADLKLGKNDKRVVMAFLDKKSMDGNKLSTDGKRLDGNWMGWNKIAEWKGGKIVTTNLGSRAADTVQRYLRKEGPANDFK
jgi:hypothetical protein